MRCTLICLLATLGLYGCAHDRPYDSRPLQIHELPGVLYVRGDGSAVIQCQGGSRPTTCGELNDAGGGSLLYLDCSDARFECLYDTSDVLAVPKAGLAPGQRYTAFGAEFVVDRCFGDQPSCEIALIRSTCTDASTCRCRPSGPNRSLTFYYSRERGITSFYPIGLPEVPGVDAQLRADAAPLLTYVLVAERGFLRAPLALRPAESRRDASNSACPQA